MESNPSRTVAYIMGAGRSGTTALSVFLGGHHDCISLADLMAFFKYYGNNFDSGNGIPIREDLFWKPIFNLMPNEVLDNACNVNNENKKMERHSALPFHLLHLVRDSQKKEYLKNQEALFEAIFDAYSPGCVVDSSKYTSRAMALMSTRKFDIKTIYNVRDPRGVVWSFKKKVQTPKSPLKALLYYLSVNIGAQIVYWRTPKTNMMKIRYEDLVSNPRGTLEAIGKFLSLDYEEVIQNIESGQQFDIGPIVEGNRLKAKKKIALVADDDWKTGLRKWEQVLYYWMCAPLMFINKYKL